MQNNVLDISKTAPRHDSERSGKRPRREFSNEEKRAIVTEANQTSVAAAARAHNLKPNQIRGWRRRFFPEGGDTGAEVSDDCGDLRSELQSALAMIAQHQRFAQAVSKRLASESESGKGAGYNLSCGLSNVTNSICKLLELRLSLVERLELLREDANSKDVHDFENPEPDVRKAAEAMVYELVKQQVQTENRARTSGSN